MAADRDEDDAGLLERLATARKLLQRAVAEGDGASAGRTSPASATSTSGRSWGTWPTWCARPGGRTPRDRRRTGALEPVRPSAGCPTEATWRTRDGPMPGRPRGGERRHGSWEREA